MRNFRQATFSLQLFALPLQGLVQRFMMPNSFVGPVLLQRLPIQLDGPIIRADLLEGGIVSVKGRVVAQRALYHLDYCALYAGPFSHEAGQYGAWRWNNKGFVLRVSFFLFFFFVLMKCHAAATWRLSYVATMLRRRL